MCRACGSFYFFEYAPRFRDVFSKNDEIFALASFLLVLKSPVVQLSMINRDLPWVLAFPLPGSSRLSRGQLIYYITSASTCQGVLQNFLKKFFRSPHRRACCALSQSFWIIPHFPCFVKGVRQSFCRFSGTFLRGTKQAALRISEFPLWEKGFRGGGGAGYRRPSRCRKPSGTVQPSPTPKPLSEKFLGVWGLLSRSPQRVPCTLRPRHHARSTTVLRPWCLRRKNLYS